MVLVPCRDERKIDARNAGLIDRSVISSTPGRCTRISIFSHFPDKFPSFINDRIINDKVCEIIVKWTDEKESQLAICVSVR